MANTPKAVFTKSIKIGSAVISFEMRPVSDLLSIPTAGNSFPQLFLSAGDGMYTDYSVTITNSHHTLTPFVSVPQYAGHGTIGDAYLDFLKGAGEFFGTTFAKPVPPPECIAIRSGKSVAEAIGAQLLKNAYIPNATTWDNGLTTDGSCIAMLTRTHAVVAAGAGLMLSAHLYNSGNVDGGSDRHYTPPRNACYRNGLNLPFVLRVGQRAGMLVLSPFEWTDAIGNNFGLSGQPNPEGFLRAQSAARFESEDFRRLVLARWASSLFTGEVYKEQVSLTDEVLPTPWNVDCILDHRQCAAIASLFYHQLGIAVSVERMKVNKLPRAARDALGKAMGRLA